MLPERAGDFWKIIVLECAAHPCCFSILRHVGCDCVDGFEGEHCEARAEAADEIVRPTDIPSSDGASSGVVAFSIILVAVAVSIAAIVFYRTVNRRKEEIEEPIEGPVEGNMLVQRLIWVRRGYGWK